MIVLHGTTRQLAEDYNNFKRAGAEVIAISADQQSFAWSMGNHRSEVPNTLRRG